MHSIQQRKLETMGYAILSYFFTSPKTPQEDTSLHHLLPGRKFPRGGLTPLETALCSLHLPEDPLHQHCKYALTSMSPSSLSWFHQVRDLCLQYNLPHPLVLLDKPVPKSRFKRLAKLKVTEYWHHVLATECSSPSMTSLRYFDPFKASLLCPHPMWSSTAGNSFECSKSTVLARMVSGRYRTEAMCRFWSTNRSGFCLSDTCQNVRGDLEHMLIVCPALEHTRHRLHSLWCRKTVECPPLHRLILRILASTPETQVRFILDSTACPEIISLSQFYGQEIQDRILYLTRTWAFSIHRQKMKILGRWPECQQPSRSHPKPSSPPSPIDATLPVPPRHYTPSNDSSDIAFTDATHTELSKDSFGRGECFSNGISVTETNLITNLIVTGSTNAHLPSTFTPPVSRPS